MSQLPALTFLWPRMLWLLAIVPILAGLYTWQERRRRGTATLYPALKIVGLAMKGGAGWRRHLPLVLLLLGLAALLAAVARPQAMMMLPSRIQTVILALDMSGSMRADDVKPSRIVVARQAAKAFLDEQPTGVKVGVVAVSGTASVAQAPSRSKEDVAAALDRLQPQRGSALGSGLVIALTTLLPQAGIDAERFMTTGKFEPPKKPDAPGNTAGGASAATPLSAGSLPAGTDDAATPGSDTSGAIVLFSDGEANSGPDVILAAQIAAKYGVRIYTVGIGTKEGAVLALDGMSARVKLDDDVLKKIADITGARYFRIDDATELKQVYRSLTARLAFEKRDLVEITALLTGLGALLAACTGLLSLWWFGRVL
jgi:Ca-activated chloride channel family protein